MPDNGDLDSGERFCTLAVRPTPRQLSSTNRDQCLRLKHRAPPTLKENSPDLTTYAALAGGKMKEISM
jgi:hypothetical protein